MTEDSCWVGTDQVVDWRMIWTVTRMTLPVVAVTAVTATVTAAVVTAGDNFPPASAVAAASAGHFASSCCELDFVFVDSHVLLF